MSFTADYPGAIVVQARNYGYIVGGKHLTNSPKAWCLHTPEELADNVPSTPYYFAETNRDASTHYFVSYLGLVFQCVPELEGAYANAVEGKPYPVWADSKVNLNLQTLSVEIEGMAATIHQTMPRGSPQWKALVALLAHRCKARNIPPGRTFPHKDVSIYRSDPGQLNIPLLVTDVIAALEDDMALTAEDKAEIEKMILAGVLARIRHDYPTFRDEVNHLIRAANIPRDQAAAALKAQVAALEGAQDALETVQNTHAADDAKHAGGGVSEERVKQIVRELVAD